MSRQIHAARNSLKNIQNVTVEFLLKNARTHRVFDLLRDQLWGVPHTLKAQSGSLLRVWAHQCECVLAQRLRRGQQMFCLYTKLWEENSLRDFVRLMKLRLLARRCGLTMGALGVLNYDWRSQRITEAEIHQHSHELDYVHKLRDRTLCEKCDRNSRICQCERKKSGSAAPKVASFEGWKVFIEKSDMVVWRRLHPSGHYEYKVFGSYNDVVAEDFLNVQIDIEYRRQWDATAVVLNVVETDPEPSSNSDIIYWEMLWPKLFSNRDYVFNRRYLVDRKSKTLYVMSKSTTHPKCPKETSKYRIEDYWSYMVIKPYTELNKPGIEFSLTYFDNPGLNIPSSVTNWVAMKAMPDFLERLREASKKYRTYCAQKGIKFICNVMDDEFLKKTMVLDFLDEDLIVDNTIYEACYKITSSFKKPSREAKTEDDKPPESAKSDTSSQEISSSGEKNNLWRSGDEGN